MNKNDIQEVAEPLSKGEKNFKAMHKVLLNKKLVPGVTDQDHVFNGIERKKDQPTASSVASPMPDKPGGQSRL